MRCPLIHCAEPTLARGQDCQGQVAGARVCRPRAECGTIGGPPSSRLDFMHHSTILFDLDGTLTDPREGITRSIQHALAQLGIDLRRIAALCGNSIAKPR